MRAFNDVEPVAFGIGKSLWCNTCQPILHLRILRVRAVSSGLQFFLAVRTDARSHPVWAISASQIPLFLVHAGRLFRKQAQCTILMRLWPCWRHLSCRVRWMRLPLIASSLSAYSGGTFQVSTCTCPSVPECQTFCRNNAGLSKRLSFAQRC